MHMHILCKTPKNRYISTAQNDFETLILFLLFYFCDCGFFFAFSELLLLMEFGSCMVQLCQYVYSLETMFMPSQYIMLYSLSAVGYALRPLLNANTVVTSKYLIFVTNLALYLDFTQYT